MRLFVAVALVAATASTSQADREASFEADAGVTRMSETLGPELGMMGGVRLDRDLVVGARLFGFYLPETEEHHGDVGSVTASATVLVLGPAGRIDVPHTPLWFAGGPVIGGGTSGGDISFAAGFEARLGVAFWRIEKQAFTLCVNGRAYAADAHTVAWQASATIGYLVN